MTVINAMRFNAKEGAMVADEQVSGNGIVSDIATKISTYSHPNVTCIVGGSGAGLFYKQVMDAYNGAFRADTELSREGAANLVSATAARRLGEIADGKFRAKYGVGIRQLFNPKIAAKFGVVDEIAAYRNGQHQMQRNHSVDFSVLVQDNSETALYEAAADSNLATPLIGPFNTSGSGQFTAGAVLADFTERRTRDGRKDIDPLSGLIELIRALNAASNRNSGVGGTPQIVALRNGTAYSPNDLNSKLASEIVLAADEGLVKNDFCRESIDNIVYKNASFDVANKAFQEAASNKNKLDLFLRGYKI